MVKWQLPTRLFLPALALLLAAAASPAMAGSQLQQDLAGLAQEAGIIFEGRVIDEQVRWVDHGTAIATFVTFEVSDLLKGYTSSKVVTLRFLGGEIDGVRMEIGGLERPVLGEHGVYFVAPDSDSLFHPLAGGDQGHFLVIDVDRRSRILTGAAQPVLAIDRTAKSGGPGLTAAGVTTGPPERFGDAIALDTFKSLVSVLAEQS